MKRLTSFRFSVAEEAEVLLTFFFLDFFTSFFFTSTLRQYIWSSARGPPDQVIVHRVP